MVFDGAHDTQKAFGDRSDKEISDLVVELILVLVEENVLDPDRTNGNTARYRLLVSTAELDRVYFRLAAEKIRRTQMAEKSSVLILR